MGLTGLGRGWFYLESGNNEWWYNFDMKKFFLILLIFLIVISVPVISSKVMEARSLSIEMKKNRGAWSQVRNTFGSGVLDEGCLWLA
jgi:hypothetical protein